MILLLSFLLLFMFRFIKVALSKDVHGNLSYVQLLNGGMPLIKGTYYDKEAYIESNTSITNLILEALNIKPIDPIDLAMEAIPYFNSMSKIAKLDKPDSLDVTNILSFNLNDDTIDMFSNEEMNATNATVNNAAYDPSLKKALDQSKPEVLIYHTHTAENYGKENNRSTDDNVTVVGVGNLVAKELEENYGISVIHDKTFHSSDYNASYARSKETVKKYLNKYGDFKLIVDIHRDTVGDHNRKAVVTNINGEDTAKILPVTTKNTPHFSKTTEIAMFFINKGYELFPGLVRRKEPLVYNNGSKAFNHELSPNSILIECGAVENAPQEAMATAKYIARLIAEYINR
ncbi:stage II sporulation protein P [Clostridium tarantellae]|uniref:Stage II sporulation protein P n=2 Tax=Clostridium tarantellae TaxID=39493 RepID=A0A6I1MJD0_9CLOT|nr:stage II sporulation protein P [Clostridium tarantellae]